MPSAKNITKPRGCALLASLLCVMALPIAAGCGEASTTSQVANHPTAVTTTATIPAGTTAAESKARSARSAASRPRVAGQQISSHAKTSAGQALSSLANAKPANKLPASQRARLAVDDIELTSPSMHTHASGLPTIGRENTCNGKDLTPALNWKNIPPNTVELAIFIISTTPVDKKLFYDWAVTGIEPSLHGISAGHIPPTAHLNTSYTICPPQGKDENYLVALFALPQKLPVTPGENPNELHKLALHTAHHSGLLVGSYQNT
jgi:phosphatidylethanolamine-binding protein (PEBP) family uncharacterized protein